MSLLNIPLALICLLALLISCKQSSPLIHNAVSSQLDSLLQAHEIFKAKRVFDNQKHRLSQIDSLIFSAKLENTFNNSQASNNSITHLIQNYSIQLNDTVKSDLLKTKLQNHVRLFEYQQAANTTIEIIENYSSYIDSSELAELNNELNIWNGLRNELPQSLIKKDYSKIELIGGSRITTFFNHSDTSVDMIFDTGANISLIIESLADSLKIKYLDASVNVQGILGNKVTAKVGMASSMSFGNVELKNVVLLVFPDSALYYEEADFQIYGITGYPVISALGEIQRTREGVLIIPSEVSKSSYSNLALDYLTPLIEVVSEKDSLVFTFDTGAGRTWLFEKYYRANKDKIESEYQKTEIGLGGVGAVNKYQVFLIDFPFSIGQSSSILESTVVFDRMVNKEHHNYSGNLGQDVVHSFDKMILNFDFMFVEFSNK